MKALIKKIIQWKLRFFATIYIKINRIEIIGITGSAGKTTTKITLGQIVPKELLYVPIEAYNTEYGVPLALFNESVPENPNSLLGWTMLLVRITRKIFTKAPFSRIVLEYGADKPGDISYLTKFAKPHIAVVTSVLPVHLEGFGTLEAISEEKAKLVESLGKDDFAVINFDDKRVREMTEKIKARTVTFGKSASSDIVIRGFKFNEHGMAFDIVWKGSKYPVSIPVLAPQLLPSYISAYAVALLLGEDPKFLAEKLSNLKAEKGRMNLLEGREGSLIIDDSYNSNPESAKAALNVLSQYSGRKIAVLGSMNELGNFTEKGHKEVAEEAIKIADIIVIIGEVASRYMYPVIQKKMNIDTVKKFDSSKAAGEYLRSIIKKNDIVLVKGSQNGVFAEEAIKPIMKAPEEAMKLLVRQGVMWENKKGKI